MDGMPGQTCIHDKVSSCLSFSGQSERRCSLHDSFLCPLKVTSSFMARMSNTRVKVSREAVATVLPSGFHSTAWTVFLWLCLLSLFR